MVDFYCYDDGKGKPDDNGQRPTLWQRWYDAQNNRVKTKHDAVLRILKTLSVWGDPYFHGVGNGVEEIIIKADLQWRVLGYRSTDLKEFTAVHICYHKDKRYYPQKDSKDIAQRIMTEIQNGTLTRVACEPPE